MINSVIKLLQLDNFYNVSKEVEIAKGKYKRITKFRDFRKQFKRIMKWQKSTK